MLQVRRGEGCLVIYSLVAFFKVEKRKVTVSDAWFRVLPLSLFLRAGVFICWLSAFFWSAPLSRNLSFISFFSSNWIKLGFLCFLPRRSLIGRTITFNCFYFFTNFINISLCADPMCRNPFYYFEESLSTDNLWWMLLWALVAITICVYNKLEEITFGHITSLLYRQTGFAIWVVWDSIIYRGKSSWHRRWLDFIEYQTLQVDC